MGVKFWVHLGGKPGRRNGFVFHPVQIEKIETSIVVWKCGGKNGGKTAEGWRGKRIHNRNYVNLINCGAEGRLPAEALPPVRRQAPWPKRIGTAGYNGEVQGIETGKRQP